MDQKFDDSDVRSDKINELIATLQDVASSFDELSGETENKEAMKQLFKCRNATNALVSKVSRCFFDQEDEPYLDF